jgi:hypothetical protein
MQKGVLHIILAKSNDHIHYAIILKEELIDHKPLT